MQEFSESEINVIRDMQQVILENTSDLSDKTRAKVYSRFQAVRYFYLDMEEAQKKHKVGPFTSAFYSPYENRIYFIKNYEFNVRPDVLIHEMIHAVTRDEKSSNIGFFSKIGFANYSIYRSKNRNILTAFVDNAGLNEGMTEFFATKFYKDKKFISYQYFVNIVSILCNDCGYDNFKELYFNNDFDGFKKLLKNVYHLKEDYLIDKLFLQMNIVDYLYKHGKTEMSSTAQFKLMYQTLIKMQISKIMFENKYEILKDSDVFKFLDIKQFLNSGMTFDNKLFLNDLIIDDLEKNMFSLLEDRFDSMGYQYMQNFITYIVEKMCDKDFKDFSAMRDNSGKTALKIIMVLNQVFSMANNEGIIPASKVMSIFLYNLHDKNGKINLDKFSNEEKYEFLTNIIYSPYNLEPKPYIHFYPKDLVEYMNSGKTEFKAFCNTNAINYIKSEVKNLKSSIFFNESFIYSFQKANQKLFEDQDNIIK